MVNPEEAEESPVKKEEAKPAPKDDSIKPKALHGKAAIKEVESQEGKLSAIEKRIVEVEGYSSGDYKDDKGITTGGVGQTGSIVRGSF